ncbi:acetate--CoA ligase [Ornithinimicrobium pratense]|uniref:Acetyl-coenzyme A synthetase n=1 Tax=Ornithinimicrobium pratense TaxID=2593973 RepID=A0A5J6V933_9MICO|nr:acetate--CoA ligase [Ornithinimicrobium pratense]QFG69884.1 acetate--CoA ligase [Ornithinimicrobium pratense]
MSNEGLSNLLHEERTFEPSEEFRAQANAGQELFDRAAEDREGFWAEQARRYVQWETDFEQVLDWSEAPFAKWFLGGRLNACVNAVDRHVEVGHGDRVAIHWVGEPEGETRDITYAELHQMVQRAANALADLGVGEGDTVAIYLPMIPEAAIAMLACARLGAPHSVVFGGFSAEALHSRIDDAGAKVVITADGGYRRGKPSALKPAVDAALAHDENPVQKVLVVQRTGQDVDWTNGRDLWWHEALEAAAETHEAQAFDAEHPLFILYTSGTTGKPKGIFHATGGYLVQTAYTSHVVHDLHPDSDVYWCTADIGWVTGHSYIVYGPMTLGATQVMYEGTPDTPHQGRFWEIVQDLKVTVLYTAPTAIRTFMKWGTDIPAKFDLSSLRLLGSVGEPINPEAWMWYREHIGADRCPIVDTWWQTETGAIMISPLPGVTAARPGSAMKAIPGIVAKVVDDMGQEVEKGSGGYLVITEPWPSMLRGIWGDPKRYQETYWSRFPDAYFAGDGAKLDEDGNIWVVGRVDDVMNVSGHRMSTSEIESALVSHPKVAEAAVVGAADETTGQAICAFVILRADAVAEADSQAAAGEGEKLVQELRNHVAKEIGPIAKPRQIMVVPELPKTRSGKIMRRLLKDVAEHREVGDVTTLADSSVMSLISDGMQKG